MLKIFTIIITFFILITTGIKENKQFGITNHIEIYYKSNNITYNNMFIYELDTININKYDTLNMIGVDIYLYNKDTLLYDTQHLVISSNNFVSMLDLYNDIESDKLYCTDINMYKFIKCSKYVGYKYKNELLLNKIKKYKTNLILVK